MSSATRTKKVKVYTMAEDDGEHSSDVPSSVLPGATANSMTPSLTGSTNRIAATMSQMDGETADEIAGRGVRCNAA